MYILKLFLELFNQSFFICSYFLLRLVIIRILYSNTSERLSDSEIALKYSFWNFSNIEQAHIWITFWGIILFKYNSPINLTTCLRRKFIYYKEEIYFLLPRNFFNLCLLQISFCCGVMFSYFSKTTIYSFCIFLIKLILKALKLFFFEVSETFSSRSNDLSVCMKLHSCAWSRCGSWSLILLDLGGSIAFLIFISPWLFLSWWSWGQSLESYLLPLLLHLWVHSWQDI